MSNLPQFDVRFLDQVPLLTRSPGIGGTLKATPEDFLVEEIPAYEPSGAGEHLFLWVEKRNTSSEQMLDGLSRQLKVSRSTIGQAGIKDRVACTRQFVSVPATAEPLVEQFELEGVSILQATRHKNKLKAGHLQGNRFQIRLTGLGEEAVTRARTIQAEIEASGVPNYFGTQRFGNRFQTLQNGWRLLTSDEPPRLRRGLSRLALSAVQSYLFNMALAERVQAGTCATVAMGDVLQVRTSGGKFVAEDVAEEQRRVNAGETVITGPMFGPKMTTPRDDCATFESELLDRSGLSEESFTRFRKLTSGTRRPYLVFPEEMEIERAEAGLWFRFTLPPGSYATIALREFMKP